MKIAFRADASLRIGTGHVMRCLTLARALRSRGHECLFISRAHPGNLLAMIRAEGFAVYSLPSGSGADSDLAHSEWLGASQWEDAQACCALLAPWCPDWLVVDHYALDYRWERSARVANCRVMVLDDLADRRHDADLLIDQNLGRSLLDYTGLLPDHCEPLIGPRYALLRPEFAELRDIALTRRRKGQLQHVLVALGGVDEHNHTSLVLQALDDHCNLPATTRLTVVLGQTAPHLARVAEVAKRLRWPVSVFSGVRDMAQRMVDADLAIGAAGGTSWERCCLGLPTVLMVLAENQRAPALALANSGAALLVEPSSSLAHQLPSAMETMSQATRLRQFSSAASSMVDGAGCRRIMEAMEHLR